MTGVDAAGIIASTAIGGGFLARPAVITPLGFRTAALGLAAVWAFHVLSVRTLLRGRTLRTLRSESWTLPVPMVSDLFVYSYNEEDLLRLTFLTSRRRRRIANLLNAHGRRPPRRGQWLEHDYRLRKLR